MTIRIHDLHSNSASPPPTPIISKGNTYCAAALALRRYRLANACAWPYPAYAGLALIVLLAFALGLSFTL